MHYRSLFNRDYKSHPVPGPRRGRGHWSLRALGLAVGLVVLGAVLAKSQEPVAVKTTGDDTQIPYVETRVHLPLPLPQPPAGQALAPAATAPEQPPWTEFKVRRGDSLSAIFSRMEMHSQLAPILALGPVVDPLRRLRPGETLRIRKTEAGLQGLEYDPDETRRLRIWREGEEGYRAELVERPLERRIQRATAVIHSSLFQAGLDAGLSENLIMGLAEIFGWDIDFALDIRRGDRFTLIYEGLYRDGERLRDGRILAAEFVNQGRAFQAVLYTDPTGKTDYYSPDGRSMRKAFLRAPVDFRRISSRFTTERYHPVLGVKRPHRGVDYAAAVGTPIKAAGDGKVVFRGTKGGYGKTVIIQHGATYSTLYAHMSRFARGVGVGTRVRQGQIIGYVGQTGLATGPHLHYEFRVNGVHRNPLTVKLPTAEPLDPAYMADFQAVAQPLLAQLEVYKRTMLALQ